MTTARAAFALALTSASIALAAPLQGTWRLDQPKPSGVTLHSYLIFKPSSPGGGTVVANGSVDLAFVSERQDGADTVFSVAWGWTFRVRAEGANLRVVANYGGKDEAPATAYPVPEAESRPEPRLPLPQLRDLPDNGLARTPPMGWNSWNHFAERVDDRTVREAADRMVSSGMAAAGYTYINIDDTWEDGRGASGEIVPNSKFPDMRALAAYVHGKGLKIGIYSSPGPYTCGGYAGSHGHEAQDARTYAAWGIDYLKYDWCSAGRIYSLDELRPVYQRMGEALEACGRPIVFSLCEYGMRDPWTWGPKVGGNLWRTTGDIQDNWKSMAEIGFNQGRLAPYAGPGHWNDPDMLEVGNGGMSGTEYRTHFSLWCMLAAPLMAGNDLGSMSEETRAILTNREVIAIDQDPLGREATRAAAKGPVEVWTRPLKSGATAVGIFNRGDSAAEASVSWAEAGLARAPASARDLWLHEDLASPGQGYSGSIPAHGVVVLLAR
ncbi:MAG TPA: glycoside hydrolase family 27 protein [Opitutaceae bacterium]|jgi:alpha-galactosidase